MKITLYNKLIKYESYLFSAYYANCIRGMSNSQVEDLISVGDEIGINYKNNHCPKCLLDFVRKLAKPYFEQKNNLEEKKKEKKKCTKIKEPTIEEKTKEKTKNFPNR